MDPEGSLPYSQQPAICPLSTTKQKDTQIVSTLTAAECSSLVLYEVHPGSSETVETRLYGVT